MFYRFQKSINTVNVIETNGDTQLISGLYSFPDNKKGNLQAETLFRKICKETTDLTDEQIDDRITDGYAEVPGGGTIQLVHSS